MALWLIRAGKHGEYEQTFLENWKKTDLFHLERSQGRSSGCTGFTGHV